MCTAGSWTDIIHCSDGSVCTTDPGGCSALGVALAEPNPKTNNATKASHKPKPKPKPSHVPGVSNSSSTAGGSGGSSSNSGGGGSGGSSGGHTFSAPHYVIYACGTLSTMAALTPDTVFANNVPPTVAELGGYNRLILSFYESTGYQVGWGPAHR